MPDDHVRIFIGRAQVVPLLHLHADIGQYLIRLPPVLHEAVYGKRLIGQEIRLIEACSQRIAMVGHQPEFSGIQSNGGVFGPGISVAIQPDGLRVIYFHLKIIQRRKVFKT